MPIIQISKSGTEETIVLHFQTGSHRLNAYTLASTLVAFADAAKAANIDLNPGYDIEVVVEAIGPGSFRVKLSAILRTTKNLFSANNLKAIVLGILTNYIYGVMCSQPIKVIVNKDEVVIESGDDRIVVPRNIYEATEVVKADPQFRDAMTRFFCAVAEDEKVDGLGIVDSMDAPEPTVLVSREKIKELAAPAPSEPDVREIEQQAELYIVKAILEVGRRKWEFNWQGFRINAPVLDKAFHSRFRAHEITIAPGDQLKAKLRIRQSRDAATGIYTNQDYEVAEVLEHVAGIRQLGLDS